MSDATVILAAWAAMLAFALACDRVRLAYRRAPGCPWVRLLEQVRRALAYEEPLP